ncbi:glycoside hydrolase family 3 N-terminal domain-containing protein [Ruania halotolerans]|uniref:glycoside hydrolase family 3 N-terminal domain-containing protein n=1 Tax=Ruania halotolerans TaxID=2897773 RepID=UPI001E566EA8|nr:glycoside hydrolase family 3 N-terminal domain-containing protein [Ruania halotolerans]UFU05699.1 beta-N-acetylhexosaminidase [Ruania halotolerans]
MTRRSWRPSHLTALAAVGALALAACTPPDGSGEPTPSETVPTAEPSTDMPSETPSPTSTAEPLGWGPTEDEVDDAIAVAAEMTPEDVAGQVILARFPGTEPADAAAVLSADHLAGVVVFGGNVASAEQVADTAEAVQEAQGELGRDWPAIIAVDNEGGLVQRLSAATGDWTSFPPFMAAGAADDADVVTAAAEAMATELRATGINYDFAPVADVTIGAADPIIGDRSPSGDPERAARAVTAAVQGFADGGVLSSLKHFPGHGSLTVDSHEDLPTQSASAEELADRDLVPFQVGVDAGAPTVMMGHIAVEAWDPGVPASLSPEAYQVLREDLGFTGVAITDALDMGALTQTRTSDEIAVEALAAGADLLLGPVDVAEAQHGIVSALEDGSLDRERVNEAAGRVIALMRWQADEAERIGPVSVAESDSGGAASQALSAAAVTVVQGTCGGALAGPRIHVRGGTADDWDAFVDAAEQVGLQVVPLEQPADTSVRLLTSVTPSGTADVAISLDAPWLLTGTDAPVRIAAFGRTAGAFEAVAAVLAGDAPAPGSLPIEVDGLAATSC